MPLLPRKKSSSSAPAVAVASPLSTSSSNSSSSARNAPPTRDLILASSSPQAAAALRANQARHAQQQQQLLQTKQSSKRRLSPASHHSAHYQAKHFVAGSLVVDELAAQATPEVQERQADNIERFKIGVCTPRRQLPEKAAKYYQHQEELLVAKKEELEEKKKKQQEQRKFHQHNSSSVSSTNSPSSAFSAARPGTATSSYSYSSPPQNDNNHYFSPSPPPPTSSSSSSRQQQQQEQLPEHHSWMLNHYFEQEEAEAATNSISKTAVGSAVRSLNTKNYQYHLSPSSSSGSFVHPPSSPSPTTSSASRPATATSSSSPATTKTAAQKQKQKKGRSVPVWALFQAPTALDVNSSQNDESYLDADGVHRSPQMRAINENLDDFVMAFASEQAKYERRRHQLEKQQKRNKLLSSLSPSPTKQQQQQQQQTGNNNNKKDENNKNNNNNIADSQVNNDRSRSRSNSSTDSIVMDTNVATSKAAVWSSRRAGRLRDHYSPSVDTLQHVTVTNGGDNNILLSYLMGMERLVSFCFNTLSSKEELASIVGALFSVGGLVESGAMAFGRWPCLNIDTLHSRLEKVLPVKLDRKALFECFSGVLHDGRVVHAVLLSALRLIFYSPSPAHFLEFIFTILFVHQTNISQVECQTIYRILTNPHPLRFLVRGRREKKSVQARASLGVAPPDESVIQAVMSGSFRMKEQQRLKEKEKTKLLMRRRSSAVLSTEGEMPLDGSSTSRRRHQEEQEEEEKQKEKIKQEEEKQKEESEEEEEEKEQKETGGDVTTPFSLSLLQQKRKQQQQQQQQQEELQQQQQRNLRRPVEGLQSPACDVDFRIAGQELYFIIDYLSTLPYPSTTSWTELQRLVTPIDYGDGTVLMTGVSFFGMEGGGTELNPKGTSTGISSLSSSSSSSALSPTEVLAAATKTASGATPANVKEAIKMKHQGELLHRRHDVGIEQHRRAMRGDLLGSCDKLKSPAQCIIIAKLMGAMKMP